MPFFVSELAELFDVLLMLSTAPMLWEGDSGLKLRNLIVEVSAGSSTRVFSTVDHRLLSGEGEANLLNHY